MLDRRRITFARAISPSRERSTVFVESPTVRSFCEACAFYVGCTREEDVARINSSLTLDAGCRSDVSIDATERIVRREAMRGCATGRGKQVYRPPG
jgi:hypothetical protein